MRLRWIGAVTASLLVASSAIAAPLAGRGREAPVWQTLERFDSEADFLRYIREVRRIARARGYDWTDAGSVQFAQAEALCPDGTPPPCDTANDVEEAIAVTGARVSSPATAAPQAPSSITNVQTMGVDEGDIVKQIGQFLIVLQDGRLFVVDTRPNGQAGIALASRVNVYRNPDSDSWYDEMLVTPERVVVTGYSYELAASEISVFTFSRDGILAHEATYYISSNDYYDIENYATRLVNGRLVIYTPLDLTNVDPDEPMQWPLVRRWLRDGERAPEISKGERLFDARDIYRPVSSTLQPMVHSVSVCELGAPRPGDELQCETRGFIGGGRREFFVSTTDVFLWVTPDRRERSWGYTRECRDAPASPDANAVPATIFRMPLSGRAPSAMHARGEPLDQFGLAASEHEFRALVAWNSDYCADQDDAEVRYLHTPLAAFRTSPRTAPRRSYEHAPAPGARLFETRFTDDYVVYGGRHGWSSYPPENEPPLTSRVAAISLSDPHQVTTLEAPHDAMRVERVGDNIVVTGYRDEAGLSVSMIDLSAAPHIADTHLLEGRYESEGRSHAFNSIVDESGAGLMGLPTMRREGEAGRWWWRSEASDVSFLSVDTTGRLASLGALTANEDARDPSYRCEVSCIDWYGNSRPIFTDGRVFALSGTELIEGDVAGAHIAERRRLNLSAPLPRS